MRWPWSSQRQPTPAAAVPTPAVDHYSPRPEPEGAWGPVHPPRWYKRALAGAVVAVFVGIGLWNAMRSLRGLGVNLLVAFFLSLALEPIVVWLVKRGWRRGVAAGTALVGSIVVVIGVMALFGNLFIQQAAQLFAAVPALYESLTRWLSEQFGLQLPGVSELIGQLASRWGDDVANGALLVGSALIGGVFAVLTVMLVTFYLLAAGPKFRAAFCAYLPPDRQQEVLRLWEIAQVKVSDFLNTRIALAALCTAATAAFLLILGTPYALPLALFTGVVAQFVPTIGTYIGGALPVLVALTSQTPFKALLVLSFILVYQQVENYVFAPKISARALEINPAVAFVVVLAFGAVGGALGAFLALPVAATVQAVWSTYVRRHELVDSHMLRDPGDPAADGAHGGHGGTAAGRPAPTPRQERNAGRTRTAATTARDRRG